MGGIGVIKTSTSANSFIFLYVGSGREIQDKTFFRNELIHKIKLISEKLSEMRGNCENLEQTISDLPVIEKKFINF